MRPINVLITAVSGGSVGEQLADSLKLAKTPYRIVTTNFDSHKSGLFTLDVGYVVPKASDKNYLSTMLKIAKREKIQAIAPGSVQELMVISKNRLLFEEKGILVLLNSHEVIATCEDKLLTMNFLKVNGLKFPKFDKLRKSLARGLNFPLVIKPSVGGGGSRNVFICQDKEELAYFYDYFKKINQPAIIQEYIGTSEEEYTVGVLTDFEGRLIGSIALKRLVTGDLSTRLVTENYRTKKPIVLSSGFSQGYFGHFPDITAYAEKIALALGSKGPLNVQCRKTAKGIFAMEINPRFSGTSAMRALLGFNEIDILIRKYLLKEKINKPRPKKGWVFRDLKMTFVQEKKVDDLVSSKKIINN